MRRVRRPAPRRGARPAPGRRGASGYAHQRARGDARGSGLAVERVRAARRGPGASQALEAPAQARLVERARLGVRQQEQVPLVAVGADEQRDAARAARPAIASSGGAGSTSPSTTGWKGRPGSRERELPHLAPARRASALDRHLGELARLRRARGRARRRKVARHALGLRRGVEQLSAAPLCAMARANSPRARGAPSSVPHAHRAGRLAEDGDVRRIAAERGDVVAHPLERRDLVAEAEVRRRSPPPARASPSERKPSAPSR